MQYTMPLPIFFLFIFKDIPGIRINTTDRLRMLRLRMKASTYDAYIIPSSDEHEVKNFAFNNAFSIIKSVSYSFYINSVGFPSETVKKIKLCFYYIDYYETQTVFTIDYIELKCSQIAWCIRCTIHLHWGSRVKSHTVASGGCKKIYMCIH